MNRPSLHSAAHPGADPRCPLCRGQGVGVRDLGGLAQLQRCPCVAPCPTCEGSGYLATGVNVERCMCHVQAERAGFYDQAGIPARLAGTPLDTWVGHANLAKAEAWLTGWRPEPGMRGLLVHDPSGDDGARLLVALLTELIMGVGVRARLVDLRDPEASWPPTTAYRVLALLVLGDEPNPLGRRRLERGLATLEDSGGTLLAHTRYAPCWERQGEQGPEPLAERIDAMSAVVALEGCDALIW